MAKHVHIHLPARRHTQDAEPEGKWVTINGAHVMIGEGGKIVKGPSALVGKSATGAHLDASQHHREAGARKGEEHPDFVKHLGAQHEHTGAAIYANKPASKEYSAHAEKAAAHEASITAAKPAHKHDGVPKKHGPDPSKVGADVNSRHEDLTAQGFKHEKTVGQPDEIGGQRRHYAHPNGSRAVITHKEEAHGVHGQTPSHSVSSLVNTMNAGKKPSKAELGKQAKEAYAAANQGKGSFAKAAELYEAAGMADKAADAKALAKRYGHDKEGVARKQKADSDAAQTARAQAKRAASSQARALLHEKADLHEKRAKGDPEDNASTKRLRELNDELAFAEKDDHKGQGDMDKMREAIRKEKPDISVNDLNDEVDRRMPHQSAPHPFVSTALKEHGTKLADHLSTLPKEKLHTALRLIGNHAHPDSLKVKKVIEKELDARANRGA